MEATTLHELADMVSNLLDNHGGNARLSATLEIKPPTGVADKCPVIVEGMKIEKGDK